MEESSDFYWVSRSVSVLERGLLSLLKSREFNSNSIAFFILKDPKVFDAHFRSFDFRLINFLERIKALHTLGLISDHQFWISAPTFSSEYQDWSKWKVRDLRVCDLNWNWNFRTNDKNVYQQSMFCVLFFFLNFITTYYICKHFILKKKLII